MTNEQLDPEFERDLRATLDTLMAASAPASVHARVERTVAAGEGTTSLRRRRRRLAWLAAAIAIAVLAVPLGMNLASRQPGVAGQPSPSVSAVPSPSSSASDSSSQPASTPGASPSGPSAEQIGLPIVRLSEDVVRKSRIDSTHAGTRPGGPLTGPFLYQSAQNNTAISVLDVGGGSIRMVDPLPLGPDERAAAFLNDASWMAIVVTSSGMNDCRSGPTTPLNWRIEVAPMGSDGMPAGPWRKIASGAERSRFAIPDFGNAECAYAYPPVLALSGDVLAWSSSSGPALDAGSDVTALSLASGAKVASLRSTTRVVELDVSQEALAWVESTNLLAPGAPKVWKVMEARRSDSSAKQVDIGTDPARSPVIPLVALDGTALVANSWLASDNTSHILRVDSGRKQIVSDGSSRLECSQLLAVSAGRVVLACIVPETALNGAPRGLPFLAVWTAADGLRAVALGSSLAELPATSIYRPSGVERIGDWISWYALDFAASNNDSGTVYGDWIALPIDALAAPVP